ncbi:MAG TPA: hypothetical protein VND40_01545 [Nitrososphaerales archaeon]|nr:hypothetical protein [Nitrososphaerales archaeon]
MSSLGPMLHKPVFVAQDLTPPGACSSSTGSAGCLVADDRKMILTPGGLTVGLL